MYKDRIYTIFDIEKFRIRLFNQVENELFHFYTSKGKFADYNCKKIISLIKIHKKNV